MLKVDFSIGAGIYMLSSNLNFNIRKTARYNNKILLNNIDIKIGSNRNINKAEVTIKSLPNESIKDTETILPLGNQKKLAEKYIGEKLAITLLIMGIGIAYRFWKLLAAPQVITK